MWLEGDNKEASFDSRKYGPVPYGLIDCKLRVKVWLIVVEQFYGLYWFKSKMHKILMLAYSQPGIIFGNNNV